MDPSAPLTNKQSSNCTSFEGGVPVDFGFKWVADLTRKHMTATRLQYQWSTAQQNRDAMITSLWRQNVVLTSQWRYYCVMCPLGEGLHLSLFFCLTDFWLCRFDPIPALEGPLAPNHRLSAVEKLLPGKFRGPESMAIYESRCLKKIIR